MRSQLVLLAIVACLSPTAARAVEVDGRIDPVEWQGAQHVTDFRKVQPLNGEPASLATEAWILATPDGLAVAFRNAQPIALPRSRERLQRDFEAQVDRVNVMVDFEGGGRTGYDFVVSATNDIGDAIITNESNFNDDWDGSWQHATSEDDAGWSVELLIPWHIAPLRKADGETRRLNVYLDRVTAATGERVAWPQASFERPRFLSDFAPVTVATYNQSLLAITPYVSGLYDNVRGRSDLDGGADVFWKPSGQFQLAATINPDFGQVESDDLVVNFSATETFISDKRPFFTENQGIYEFTTPSDFSQLLYTRRIGGPADDGNGAGDITAAVKVNGSVGATKYGVFAADEGDAAGRSFRALRLVHDFDTQNLGVMVTQVERPFLDREANVVGIDHNWRPTPRISVQSRVIGSAIEVGQRADRDTTRGVGATTFIDYEMDGGWRQQWLGMHFGDDLQINDAGYLSRNDLNYAHWQVSRRFTSLPDASRYASHDWRGRVSAVHNDGGERLNDQLRISRQSQLRDGSSEYAQVNINSAGVDDLLTRGNGSLALPPRAVAHYEFERPRKGRWSHSLEADVLTGGLSGNRRVGYAVEYEPTYYVSDALNVSVGAYAEHTPDWLVWQVDNLVGRFDERAYQLNAGANWNIGQRQELRVKLQALALDARVREGIRVVDRQAVPTDEPVDSFSLRNLGFQVRYRYELAPLSYLYVVYARGGYDQTAQSEDPFGLLRDSFDLRDDEQLLVKLSYRFEI